MADLLLEVEQARSAVINAAAAMDSTDRAERERALSAAKVTMGRIGRWWLKKVSSCTAASA